MRIPGADGYRLDDTFGFGGGEIQVGVIRESDGRPVGMAAGNRADHLIRQARLIAQTDYESFASRDGRHDGRHVRDRFTHSAAARPRRANGSGLGRIVRLVAGG